MPLLNILYLTLHSFCATSCKQRPSNKGGNDSSVAEMLGESVLHEGRPALD